MMTITRALAELKLLSARIERLISESSFVAANKRSAKKVNGVLSVAEFEQNAKSAHQSIVDLIERRKKIKAAIVDSNANTFVEISGKTMSVAEAIERKDSIMFEKQLLSTMERQYNHVVATVNQQNELVQRKLDEIINTHFGKEGRQKVSDDEISIISKPYLENNEYEAINPLKLQDKIGEMKRSIEDFEMNVDFVLSESNCITKINIE